MRGGRGGGGRIAKGGQELGLSLVTVEAEQAEGLFVQVEDAQIAGGGDDDGFAGLVK